MGSSAQERAQKLANDANIQMTDSTNQANRDIAKETNQANLDIAHMNNQYNRENLERQIDEQWKMWNAENEYNSASAQRARLEEAGLNPYMMMSGGSAGSATAMNGSSAFLSLRNILSFFTPSLFYYSPVLGTLAKSVVVSVHVS